MVNGIKKLLNSPEDEYHDFKQKWHNDNSELVRDILNFVNTTHHEDCYIIFGVSDSRVIVGIEEDTNRKDTESLLDLLHNLYLSTNTQISVKVETIDIDGKEIDILTIFNTDLVPVYLTKEYKPKGSKGLPPGLIYSRNGAINTPRDKSAPFEAINSLFKKYHKLDVPIQERYKKVLSDAENWSYIENEEGYFFIYNLNPDFYMKLYEDTETRYQVEAYSISQTKCRISWHMLELRYRNIAIDERLLNFLDGGRILVPSPNSNGIKIDSMDLRYYYIERNSLSYILFGFLNVVFPVNKDHLDSLQNFQENIVIIENSGEKDKLHAHLQSNFAKDQIERFISPSEDEIEQLYNHIKQTLPEVEMSKHSISQILMDKKTTQLLNEIKSVNRLH